MYLDALPSRLPFAVTVAFNIVLPSLAIGLASYLAVLEGLWLASRNDAFRNLYLFWARILVVAFGLSVFSELVMSFQRGAPSPPTSTLLVLVGEGGLMAVMLFGWTFAGERLHFAATLLAVAGALLSVLLGGQAWRIAERIEALLSPGAPEMFWRALLAAYLLTALVVGAASAWRLLREPGEAESGLALRMAVGMLAIVAPLQLAAGHLSPPPLRLEVARLGAGEPAPAARAVRVVAWPASAAPSAPAADAVSPAGNRRSAVLSDLSAPTPSDAAPAVATAWAFRIMVAVELAAIAIGLWGAMLCWRGAAVRSRGFLTACTLMGPAAFGAAVAGWIVAGGGAGSQAASRVAIMRPPAVLTGGGAPMLLLSAAVACAVVAGGFYMLKLMAKGPPSAPAAS